MNFISLCFSSHFIQVYLGPRSLLYPGSQTADVITYLSDKITPPHLCLFDKSGESRNIAT